MALLLQTSCKTTVDTLPNEERKIQKKINPFIKKDAVALVLGGGGARGIAHLAALEVLEEANIPIDFIVGCSSGSIVGSLYAADVDVKKIKSLLFKAKSEEMIERSKIPKQFGLLRHTKLREFLKKNLTAQTFDQLKIPLIVVATDLITGELVEFEDGPLVPPIIASSSIPLLFEPIKYDNRILVDGGVIAALPIKTAKKKNPALIIAIDIANCLSEEKPKNMFTIAQRSIKIMHRELSKEQSDLADVVIRTKMDMDSLEENSKIRRKFYLSLKKEIRKKIPEIKSLYYKKVQRKKPFIFIKNRVQA